MVASAKKRPRKAPGDSPSPRNTPKKPRLTSPRKQHGQGAQHGPGVNIFEAQIVEGKRSRKRVEFFATQEPDSCSPRSPLSGGRKSPRAAQKQLTTARKLASPPPTVSSPRPSPSKRRRGSQEGSETSGGALASSPKLLFTAQLDGRILGSFTTADQAAVCYAKAVAELNGGGGGGGDNGTNGFQRIRGNPHFTRECDVPHRLPRECLGRLADELPSTMEPKLAAQVARVREWLPRDWRIHSSPLPGAGGGEGRQEGRQSPSLTFSHPICHQRFTLRREIEDFLDGGYTMLPRMEPVKQTPKKDGDATESAPQMPEWDPKPDPYAAMHSEIGVPLERGFKAYRRVAAKRPVVHPDANDLLEAYYFHSPHEFKPGSEMASAAPEDTLEVVERPDRVLPEPFEKQLIEAAGGQEAWQRCAYANAEWRRTAKLQADVREQKETERLNVYQPIGLAADSWDR